MNWAEICHEGRVIRCNTFLSFRRIFANRRILLTNLLGMLANNLLFFVTWVLIFQLTPHLRGWNLADVAMMYGLGASSFGLACSFFGGFRQLTSDIETGRFDTFLAKPVSPFTLMLTSATNPASWGDCITGPVFWLLFCHLNVLQFLFLVFAAINGAVVCTAIGVVIYSASFWLANIRNQTEVVLFMVISLLTTPLHGMPMVMKIVLFTIIPVAFITLVPIQTIHQPSIDKVLYMLLGAVGLMVVARMVFYWGLQSYKGVSSMTNGN